MRSMTMIDVVSGIRKAFSDNAIHLIFAFFGFVLILIGTSKHGIGLFDDSMTYINCAENLVEGNGFYHMDGSAYHEWAPLLPSVLSIPVFLDLPINDFGLVLYTIIFASMIFVTGRIISNFTRSRTLLLIGLSLALLSRPNYHVGSALLSELPFNFLVLISLFIIYKYTLNGNRRLYWLLILTTSLACLTRYIGVTLIISGSLVMLLGSKEINLKKRIKDPIIFGLLSSLPTIFFLIRNYILSGTLIGERFSPLNGLIENVLRTYRYVAHWFIPKSLPTMIWGPLSLLIFLLIGSIIVYKFLDSIRKREKDLVIIAFGVFILSYTIFLIISSSTVGFDALTDRFFSPLYLPAVIVIIHSINGLKGSNRIKKMLKGPHGSKTTGFLIIPLILLLIGAGSAIIEEVEYDLDHGAGNYGTDWVDSEIMEYLRNNQTDGAHFSNYPNPVHYFSDLEKVGWTPRERIQGCSEHIDGFEEFNETIPENGDIYIIWITISERNWLYDIDDMIEVYPLVLVETFEDGQIYKMDIER